MSIVASYIPGVLTPFGALVGNGVSAQSRAITGRLENVAEAALRTGSIGLPRQTVLEALLDALDEAADEDWEGYGGQMVSPRVFIGALRFVWLLPASVPVPDVTIDPDGEVLFEWYRSPYRVFSVSVGAGGKSAYAGLLEDEKVNGTERISDSFPRTFIEAIKKVYAVG